MFNSYDILQDWMGGSNRRFFNGLTSTKILTLRTLPESVYVLAYRGSRILEYYPTHIKLNLSDISPSYGEAYRKRLSKGLPPSMKVSNRQGKPYIVDSFKHYHTPSKDMVFTWDGIVINPWTYSNTSSMIRYIRKLYKALQYEDVSVFTDNECILCGSTTLTQSLSTVLGMDYHFYDHLAHQDVGLNTVLEMCEAWWQHVGEPVPNTSLSATDIRSAMMGDREFDHADFDNLEVAFKWFIKEKMGIDCEEL